MHGPLILLLSQTITDDIPILQQQRIPDHSLELWRGGGWLLPTPLLPTAASPSSSPERRKEKEGATAACEVFIGVASRPGNSAARAAMRQTWLGRLAREYGGKLALVRFEWRKGLWGQASLYSVLFVGRPCLLRSFSVPSGDKSQPPPPPPPLSPLRSSSHRPRAVPLLRGTGQRP